MRRVTFGHCFFLRELELWIKTDWGEIDRQSLLPFGTPDDVKASVRRVRHALDDSSGGVIAQCEWGNDVPTENVAAVFEAWLE